MMPQNSRLNIEHWYALMTALKIAPNDDSYHMLIKAYSERHRAYHTLEHIAACFGHLDKVADEAVYAFEIELALWFHDVIYKPFSSQNEEDSAKLAKEFLTKNNVATEVITRIHKLIIYTKDHAVPEGRDAQLMLDIDLGILGTPRGIYEQFEKDIRKEYRHVPSFIFKKKRKEILENFIERQRLYHTQHFFDRLEGQARENLSWAISQL